MEQRLLKRNHKVTDTFCSQLPSFRHLLSRLRQKRKRTPSVFSFFFLMMVGENPPSPPTAAILNLRIAAFVFPCHHLSPSPYVQKKSHCLCYTIPKPAQTISILRRTSNEHQTSSDHVPRDPGIRPRPDPPRLCPAGKAFGACAGSCPRADR